MTATTVHHAAGDAFARGLRAFFEYRDLGIAGASGGKIGAHVIRAVPGRGPSRNGTLMIRHREVRHNDDVEMLEITSPAEFVTAVVVAPR